MKYKITFRLIITLFIPSLLLIGCSKNSSNPAPTTQNNLPTLTSLSVDTGVYGASVKISGTGFSTTLSDDKVFFNGKQATVTAATSTQISATVPLGAGTGKVSVSVNNGTQVNGPTFVYQLSAVVTTLAGNDKAAYVDGKGANASFSSIWGITLDSSGNIYVSDGYYIRKVTPDGTVTTLAGNSNGNSIGWDVDGKGNAATFSYAASLTTDISGNVYIADASRIRKMTPDGTVSTFWISKNLSPLPQDLTGIVLDASGNLYVSDAGSNVIVKVKPDGTSAIFAGSGANSSVDGQGTSATFSDPIDMAIDGSGNLFVVDLKSNKIRKVTPSGNVTTIAGNGNRGAANGSALQASFYSPDGIAVDNTGNLFIGDFGNYLVREISSNGTVSTIAGTGKIGTPSVDGTGTSASFGSVNTLKIDASGAIYVADYNKIRKITFQ